ncbi:hypothetical protein AYO40_00860 [Planctomycetaceae bacterium SCGC AG-212-D15]|nr:hypothetical protein AYO40_00860 [Planctomycetaceae bacterium SCGC AG-212-D15]
MPDLRQLLDLCREALGPAPRDFSKDEENYFRLRPSLFTRGIFLLTGDNLQTVLRDQHYLRDLGRVVWGFLVQANEVLFKPANQQVLPANVIYSADTYFDDQVPFLQKVASGLFELKGTAPGDKELVRFSEVITNETARTMRLALPGSLCRGKAVFFTTCLIQPAHLPGGYLASGFFPLLICPEKTEAVMIVPYFFWPDELCKLWTAGDEDEWPEVPGG